MFISCELLQLSVCLLYGTGSVVCHKPIIFSNLNLINYTDIAMNAFFWGKNAKESKWTWCNAARLDHMHRNKSAYSALFSLLLTPDLLLKNIVSRIALPLMMCNHTGFLHNAFSVERVYQEPEISRDILGRWWYSTSLNRKSTRRHIFTPQ